MKLKASMASLFLAISFCLGPIAQASTVKDLGLQIKTMHEAGSNYDISLSYPIFSKNLTPAQIEFNNKIQTFIDNEVSTFKEDAEESSDTPTHTAKNELVIDTKLGIFVKPIQVVSVLLAEESMSWGQAHPKHKQVSFNYDLAENKLLNMQDLFKRNSKYLRILSNFCYNELNKKLPDNMKFLLESGVAPSNKNYNIWNMTKNGLLVTFTEYQVAPYFYGVQQVLVPYTRLKTEFSIDSKFYNCFVNKACQFYFFRNTPK